IPLIFFAILDAFVQTQISGRQGVKMLVICAVNIAVAFSIGLAILNVWQPGRTWQGTMLERVQQLSTQSAVEKSKAQDLANKAQDISLSPLEMIRSYVPRS